MSLPKTIEKQWENADLLGTKQNIYHSKGFDESYQKIKLLLNLSHCVKSYGQFMSSFTMTTHQIWSFHVNLAINFENF